MSWGYGPEDGKNFCSYFRFHVFFEGPKIRLNILLKFIDLSNGAFS